MSVPGQRAGQTSVHHQLLTCPARGSPGRTKTTRSFVCGDQHEEVDMKTLIGAAIVTAAVALAGPAAIEPAAAASAQIKAKTAGASGATDVSARRYYRHHRYGYRPY